MKLLELSFTYVLSGCVKGGELEILTNVVGTGGGRDGGISPAGSSSGVLSSKSEEFTV